MAEKKYAYKNIFPEAPRVREILVADVGDLPYEEQVLLTVLQGLVNRGTPQVYLCFNETDILWPKYYRKRFGIKVKRLADPWRLLGRFGEHVKGAILYDPKLWDTLNLAVMLGGPRNLVPLSPTLHRRLKKEKAIDLPVADDLRGRFENGYECNLWAFRNLLGKCHPHIAVNQSAGLYYRTGAPHILDYVVAHNLFLFCLSESMKDRTEVALVDRIYQALKRPTYIMGWHHQRTAEVEHVARPARNGCFITCNVASPNFTVHSGIRARPKYRPRKLSAARRRVERKVYVTFTVSDGDALWCVNDFFRGHYNDKERGRVPVNWEVQTLTCHLAPGQLQYYFDTMTGNDCPVAALSGAGYTYPHLHPDPASYLKYTESYMKRTGVEFIYSGWQDPFRAWYWCETESEEIVRMYRRHVPSARGFLRNYGAWGVPERQFVEKGKAPFFCSALYVNVRRNIADEIEKVAKLVPMRPLFLTVHVREDCPPRKMVEENGVLKKRGHETVCMDEFVAKLASAQRKGWIDGELYPNREDILASAREFYKPWWRRVLRHFKPFFSLGGLSDRELERRYKDFPQFQDCLPHNEKKRTVTTLEDDFGFAVLYAAQMMARHYLYQKGVYLTELKQGRDHFRRRMKHVPDAGVIAECLGHFLAWERRRLPLAEAKRLAQRLARLLPRLDKDISG